MRRVLAVLALAAALPPSAAAYGPADWWGYGPPVGWFESWVRPAALRAVAAQQPPAYMHATLYVCRRSARPRRATCEGTLGGLPATYVFRIAVDGRRLTLLDVR